jgi:hypothetical protein
VTEHDRLPIPGESLPLKIGRAKQGDSGKFLKITSNLEIKTVNQPLAARRRRDHNHNAL